jgi:hypothetical protein
MGGFTQESKACNTRPTSKPTELTLEGMLALNARSLAYSISFIDGQNIQWRTMKGLTLGRPYKVVSWW